ncbi:hypothetical protein DCAR_0832364 [Daucus carota subsp. sativus]|uniref:Phytocyanin domain-containing protein n=2 Tax=Daucus carota subsp. sativus TaxID=79200 RepID=A0AAF0XRK0_DAUCS|nr:hypothetical protein DCAR_0832364 [Daucus carota subsp. sativus]
MEKKEMIPSKTVSLGLLILVSQLQVSMGAVYKVGDSAGWTIAGSVDYRQWSAPKTFHVGDIILFQYNSQFHNVMQVHHAEYKSCNASAPIVTHTTGNDSITITSKGHHFFLCGIPGHCQAGQKVDINVLRVSSSKAPTSSATSPSSPSSSPAVTILPPSLSPSKATSLLFSTCRFAQLFLAVAVIVLLV